MWLWIGSSPGAEHVSLPSGHPDVGVFCGGCRPRSRPWRCSLRRRCARGRAGDRPHGPLSCPRRIGPRTSSTCRGSTPSRSPRRPGALPRLGHDVRQIRPAEVGTGGRRVEVQRVRPSLTEGVPHRVLVDATRTGVEPGRVVRARDTGEPERESRRPLTVGPAHPRARGRHRTSVGTWGEVLTRAGRRGVGEVG